VESEAVDADDKISANARGTQRGRQSVNSIYLNRGTRSFRFEELARGIKA
jgi:hypothetical protein